MVKFNQKLVDAVAMPNIKSVEDILDNAPYFCQSMQFKKIVWEELHDEVRKSRRNLVFRRSKLKKASTLQRNNQLSE